MTPVPKPSFFMNGEAGIVIGLPDTELWVRTRFGVLNEESTLIEEGGSIL